MAAGQGFKTFATGDVLSAADVNGYLMQGVLVFADATERNAEITSPQEGQFAYLKDTNVTTYYTGSAWANLDTTGMTNPMTTTGDTIYSSSGSTPARLGIGSTGQVLTVAGGVPSWATPAGGGGKVGQVVSTTKSNSFSTNSGSYTDVTGLSVSITPTLATSKIMVFVDVQVVGDNGVGSAFWQLVRGATAIAIGDQEGSNRRRSTGQAYSADNNTAFSGSINFLDSPSTTSATTYKVQILADGGGSAYVNRSEAYGDTTNHATGASTITVMEILA